MNISEIFIRRPVATILLVLGLLGAGIGGYSQLPVAALPQADYPTISVSAQLAGASPDTMASSVATPLIKQFETIAGITSISATSTLGSTRITLQFDLNRDIDAAAADVQAAIDRTLRALPDNMASPPSYSKQNPADSPILFLALTGGENVPPTQMDDIAENVIAPALSTIAGVAQAQVFGSKTYAVRVEVDPARLASRGLSLGTLVSAIKAANDQTPLGTLTGDLQAMTLDLQTQRTNATEFRQLIIAYGNGRVLRLGDVAQVEDSVANLRQGATLDGVPTIALAVQRQPGANTVGVVDAIRAALPQIEAGLPVGMAITVVSDSSLSIRTAVGDVERTLALTIVLVVMVIFLFLRRITTTLIPALAVPLSLIATLGIMYLLGYSIDNISLLGLTLAVGLVVDDAIVMVENIVRRIEGGQAPFQAALDGSREIAATIVSMSLSLVAVFLPILLMGGVVGRVMNEFGVVVSIAVLASAAISLTVTPMLAARLPAPRPDDAARGAGRLVRGYASAVHWTLRNRWAPLLAFGVSLVAAVWLFYVLPRSFIPTEDTGVLTVSTQARQDISYEAMAALQKQAETILRADPAVVHVVSTVGGGPGGSSSNAGSFQVQLTPKANRPPLDQTLAELRSKLSRIAGLTSYLTPQQSLRFGGRSTQSQYQVVLQAFDADISRAWSQTLQQAMAAEPATFLDVASDLQENALEARLSVDFDRAATLGIPIETLRTALEYGFGSTVATQIEATGNSYDVIVEYDQNRPWTESDLGVLRIESTSGAMVPLAAFTTVQRVSGPVAVNQSGQLASVTLSFNLPPGVSLSTATSRVLALRNQIGMPSTVSTSFAGAAQLFQQSSSNTGLLIAAAILTIYVVLGVLYESFAHPLTVLSGLPSAMLGALLALKLAGLDLSIIALIGLLMLIGIVKKNAIMMVDVGLDLLRNQNMTPVDAIQEAAVRRFRPIMMTTFAALLAAVPVAFSNGAGSELRQPLGIAVVGGLLVSQLLTLFITPTIFVEIEHLSHALRRLYRRIPARQS